MQIPLVSDTTFGLYEFHDFFYGLLGHLTLRLNRATINYEEKTLKINSNYIMKEMTKRRAFQMI